MEKPGRHYCKWSLQNNLVAHRSGTGTWHDDAMVVIVQMYHFQKHQVCFLHRPQT